MKAETAGAQIPAAAWHATGLVGRDALTIDAVDAYTLDGRIRGAGRLGWTGDQPWRFTVQARSLDLRRLRADLDGRIALEGSIEGRGFGTNAPLTARVASLHGVLWGRSLTGSGEIERRDGNYELRAVRVANGDSYARVDGRYGPTLDLVLDADLRSLAIVDPQLSGRLTAHGRVQGTPSRPSITGEATLATLRYQDVVVGGAEARIDLDLGDTRSSRVVVRATEVDSGALRFDRVEFRASGRTTEHELSLEAASPGDERYRLAGFEARIAARGAFEIDRRRWHGELASTQFSFPDGSANAAAAGGSRSFARGGERRAGLSRNRRGTVLRGGSVERAPGELAADLQRAGLAVAAPADLASRVARIRRNGPGERLDRQGTGPGLARRNHGAARPGESRHTAQQVPHRACASRRRPARPVRASRRTSAPTSSFRWARTRSIQGEARAERIPDVAMGQYPVAGRLHGASEALTALPLFVPEIDRARRSARCRAHDGRDARRAAFQRRVRGDRRAVRVLPHKLHPRGCAARRSLRRRRAHLRWTRHDLGRIGDARRALPLARGCDERLDAAQGRSTARRRHARVPHRRLARSHGHRELQRLPRHRPGAHPVGADRAQGPDHLGQHFARRAHRRHRH